MTAKGASTSPAAPATTVATIGFWLALIVPQAVLIYQSNLAEREDFVGEVKGWLSISADSSGTWLKDPLWWFVALATSLERLCYIFISKSPKTFKKVCDSRLARNLRFGPPVEALSKLLVAFKAVQVVALFGWYVLAAPLVDFTVLSHFRWVSGIQLVVLGQLLNAATFAALGMNGVLFGCQFGQEIPWVTGFPFTVAKHPQYVGVIMTISGFVLLMATGAHVTAGMLGLLAFEVLLYFTSMCLEC
jgi:hypothetical protein